MARITTKQILLLSVSFSVLLVLRITGFNFRDGEDRTALAARELKDNFNQVTVNKANSVFLRGELNESSGKRKKLILILAYLRGGSSLLGRFFSTNPEVFYWYEPMADIYNSFSMAKLMTLTLPVLYTKDGKPRMLADVEKEFIHDNILKMFTCNFMELPLEALASWTSMESSGMREYRDCFLGLLRDKLPEDQKKNKFMLTSPCEQICQRKWHGICTPSIGDSMKKECHSFLNYSRAFLSGESSVKIPDGASGDAIYEYTRCLQPIAKATYGCVHLLDDYCSNSRINAAKIARMRLEDLKIFLNSKQFRDSFDIYVIHEIRDPRGIIASRRKDHRLTKMDIGEEAQLLCHKMLQDIKAREELSLTHKDTLLQVKYEELADDPIGMSELIYRHIKESVPVKVSSWLKQNTHSSVEGGPFTETRKNSSATARAWVKRLTDDDKLKITVPCEELLEKAGYKFE